MAEGNYMGNDVLTALLLAGNGVNSRVDERYLSAKIDRNNNTVGIRDQINDLQRTTDLAEVKNLLNVMQHTNALNNQSILKAMADCCCELKLANQENRCLNEKLATEIVTETNRSIASIKESNMQATIKQLQDEILLSKINHHHVPIPKAKT